jgi:hypothetical protein
VKKWLYSLLLHNCLRYLEQLSKTAISFLLIRVAAVIFFDVTMISTDEIGAKKNACYYHLQSISFYNYSMYYRCLCTYHDNLWIHLDANVNFS